MCDSHENQSYRLLVIPYIRIRIDNKKYKSIQFEMKSNIPPYFKRIWFPRSQITINVARKFVTAPLWLAISRGLADVKTHDPKNPLHIYSWVRNYDTKLFS